MATNKQVVHYSSVMFQGPLMGLSIVGHSALVVPVDHPDTVNVVNGESATTSAIVSYDETTEQFETLNTLYVPA